MWLRTRIDVAWVFHDGHGRRITDRFKPFEAAVKKAGLISMTCGIRSPRGSSWRAFPWRP